jgi:hypothetical protein
MSDKEIFETMDDFIFIRLYGFQGKPSLLPFYFFDRLFTVEVCKQYKYWVNFFNEKRKKKFISLPWKVVEMYVNIISHLYEYTTQFDQFNLKEVQEIHGFDRKDFLLAQTFSIGYRSSFSKSMQLGEGRGDNQNSPESYLGTTLDD